MTDNLLKAEELVKQSEKKLNPGFFNKLTSTKSIRIEEAKELLISSINFFKLANDYDRAIEVLLKIAD